MASLLNQITSGSAKFQVFRAEAFLTESDKNLATFDCLLISAMSMDKIACQKVIQKWRKTCSSAPIAIGGPICCERGMKAKLGVDCAIQGELENHIPDMLVFLDIASVHSGKPAIFQGNTPPANIDYATFHRDLEFIQQYPDSRSARIYVECVRGCSNFRRPKLGVRCSPNCQHCEEDSHSALDSCPQDIPPGCGYCATHAMFGPPKSRSISALMREIRDLVGMGATRLVLGGPDLLDFHRGAPLSQTPLLTPRVPPAVNSEALRTLIHSIAELPLVQDGTVQIFYENLKASLCSEEALRILLEIPNPIFSIGVETGDAGQAKLLGRPDTPEECIAAISLAKRLGFRVHAYFIHSLPGETPETAKNTLNVLQQLRELDLEKITLYQFKSLPGTFFESYRPSMKQVKLMRPWNEKIKRFVIQYNNSQKMKFVGQVLLVDIVERHKYQQGAAIGRIPGGGPAVEIANGARFIGQRKKVKILNVVSDRLVKGKICESGIG